MGSGLSMIDVKFTDFNDFDFARNVRVNSGRKQILSTVQDIVGDKEFHHLKVMLIENKLSQLMDIIFNGEVFEELKKNPNDFNALKMETQDFLEKLSNKLVLKTIEEINQTEKKLQTELVEIQKQKEFLEKRL